MNEKAILNSLILHSQWFDNTFSAWTEAESEAMKTLQKMFRLKCYSVKDTSVNSRVINHWEEMGLLFDSFDNREKESWRRFSVIEVVWLHIIKELREYGMSLEAIKKVKEAVTFPNANYPFLMLEIYVSAWATSRDAFLVVSKEGLSGLGIAEEIEMTQILRPFPKSYITININALFSKIQTGKEITKRQSILTPMDTTVNKILHSVMFENATEIKLTTKDSKINKIEIKKEHMNPEQAFDVLRKLTKDGKRKRISLEVQDNKIIAIEEIEKTKRKAD